jgi:hypothetical protein
MERERRARAVPAFGPGPRLGPRSTREVGHVGHRASSDSARPTERAYLAQDHVIVSYNGDFRGIEEAFGKQRRARCTVMSSDPACCFVARRVASSAQAQLRKLNRG